jgi:hypothetical protein
MIMKTFSKILLLAVIAVFSFSCGGDDDPVATPKSADKSYVWSIGIDGSSGRTIKAALPITLADVLNDDAKNFVSGKFKYTGSYIQFKSPNSIPLSRLTLKIGNATYTTTDFTPDKEQNFEEEVGFLSKVFNAYTSKSKTATVEVEYVTTGNINPNEVTLNIVINGEYTWNTYSK